MEVYIADIIGMKIIKVDVNWTDSYNDPNYKYLVKNHEKIEHEYNGIYFEKIKDADKFMQDFYDNVSGPDAFNNQVYLNDEVAFIATYDKKMKKGVIRKITAKGFSIKQFGLRDNSETISRLKDYVVKL